MQSTSIDSTAYEGPVVAVAFELSSLDTFVAGAASTLLSGGALSREVLMVLQKPIPLQGTAWASEPDSLVELVDFPELLEAAKVIDEVRKACLAKIGS